VCAIWIGFVGDYVGVAAACSGRGNVPICAIPLRLDPIFGYDFSTYQLDRFSLAFNWKTLSW
jgi:hypothetical protein